MHRALKPKTHAVALTIAGSDSGGGAGIQADLKTFASLGVHGTTAITCITAQNPKRVSSVHVLPPAVVLEQIHAVFGELRPGAVKIGMLYSPGIVHALARFFTQPGAPPLIVDPIMISTSGRGLLQKSALPILRKELLPLATLVTPNLSEAEVLTGRTISSPEDMRAAARAIHRRFHCAALVKGGHLRGSKEAADIFYDGQSELLLSAPFVPGIKTHGTGCTYSAAITAYLALGKELPNAVRLAKEYITRSIATASNLNRHRILNHFRSP